MLFQVSIQAKLPLDEFLETLDIEKDKFAYANKIDAIKHNSLYKRTKSIHGISQDQSSVFEFTKNNQSKSGKDKSKS